uniref:ATP synthase F0 subunit 8 n=1 Tax=Ixodes woyliei TaxID=1933095 RepID=UPI001FF32271|nr:ATP synthase F0 subunit 8 [Ixodes woyliei]UOK09764.1 ATP synthase subunit 8 [Ixodes woyliei]
MPQLFPMNWMILLIMFLMTYLMLMSILYFFPSMYLFSSPKFKIINSFFYKW